MTRETTESTIEITLEKTKIREKLIEFDILRIISILIVVIVIHFPTAYTYPFFIHYSPYQGFLFHTMGIHVSMGSFVFVSGFGLYLNKNYRNIKTTEKLFGFLKKRFLRIFPLYWIALILFVLFLGYSNMDFLFLLAHVFGIHMIVAPIFGEPMLTLWFIGIIVIYYLIFVVLSSTGSIKRLIPTSLVILFLFAILNIYTGLVEYRFFYYYLLFVLGIISANIYTSSQYTQIKEFIRKKNKFFPLIIAFGIALLSFVIYIILTQFTFSYFISEYGIEHLHMIFDLQPGIIESAVALLLVDLLIVIYLVFIVSLFYFILSSLKLLLPKRNVASIFSTIAYSTYCVYLFHRIFLVIYSFILSEGLNIDVYALENLYLFFLFVPFIFIFSYFIQKGVDRLIKFLSERKIENVLN
ncbi:MAG: acyltransferase family protein [Promethearchaeota archaeon]